MAACEGNGIVLVCFDFDAVVVVVGDDDADAPNTTA